MSAAWQRLIDNSFSHADLVFLQHEYVESLVMNGIEIGYRGAHEIVSQMYDFFKYLH